MIQRHDWVDEPVRPTEAGAARTSGGGRGAARRLRLSLRLRSTGREGAASPSAARRLLLLLLWGELLLRIAPRREVGLHCALSGGGGCGGDRPRACRSRKPLQSTANVFADHGANVKTSLTRLFSDDKIIG